MMSGENDEFTLEYRIPYYGGVFKGKELDSLDKAELTEAVRSLLQWVDSLQNQTKLLERVVFEKDKKNDY